MWSWTVKATPTLLVFFTKNDRRDYIKIIQVTPAGEIGWTIGQKTQGRATAITISDDDEIIVTGYFSSKFTCGDQVLIPSGPENMFIMKLIQRGIVPGQYKVTTEAKLLISM
ncbi:MAG: hypothetical protein ACI9JN_000117 [Bacteroidia bacterium]|jgi:hypothetical protein